MGDIMRTLIINGSRRDGNCKKICDILKQSLRKERIISNVITPGNQKIYLCTGCMDCDESGVCDFNDDMYENIEKIKKSDCLIFVTPTRWNLLSGDIKIFMDRLNPLYVPKGLKDKLCIAIAVGASDKEDFSTNGAISSIDSFCERSEMKLILKYQFNNCLLQNDINDKQDLVNDMIQNIKETLKSI